MDRALLSTVTPVYRGAPYLRSLAARLAAVRASWEESAAPLSLVEMIFVDDGSLDSSAEVLEELRKCYSWLRVITLSRNFGQHPATIAGVLHTSGDWVATLDEDLQHSPADLERLLREAVMHSADVVYARPLQGPHGSLLRDLGSPFYKRLVSLATNNPHVSKFSSFRMIRGGIARAAAAVSARNTYYDVALCWFTSRIHCVPLELADERFRASGESGYSLVGLLRHARRLLISSDLRWSKLGVLLGGGTALLSVLASGLILAMKVFWPGFILLQGWTSVILAILFFGGIAGAMGGVLIEYVSLLLIQSLGQPLFFVVDRSGDQALFEYFSSRASNADLGAPTGAR